MAEVIGVRFKEVGKIYYFDPDGNTFNQEDMVVVETARGLECGTVALCNKDIPDEKIIHPLKKVLRQATQRDIDHIQENKEREKSAFKICEEKIKEHNLDMKLVEVEYTFDNSKILFYFTADGRVDFRTLVKDLATIFRTRIELRQIGVRDEAKMLGGLGVCGKPFCCNSFLGEFQPVSIKMAKEQGLSLSPVKISGTCGRLMCCLQYEQEAYTDLIKNSPKVGSKIDTPQGKGTVTEVALLTGIVKVKLDDAPEEAPPRAYSLKELNGECDDCHRKKNDPIQSYVDSLFTFPEETSESKKTDHIHRENDKKVLENTDKPNRRGKVYHNSKNHRNHNNHYKPRRRNNKFQKNNHKTLDK